MIRFIDLYEAYWERLEDHFLPVSNVCPDDDGRISIIGAIYAYTSERLMKMKMTQYLHDQRCHSWETKL